MATHENTYELNQPPPEDPGFLQFLHWAISLFGFGSGRLRTFINSLVTAFKAGLPITHQTGGEWFATLDRINPEDSQVAAQVRLSRNRPALPQKVPAGVLQFEERGRKLFSKPLPETHTPDADLLLIYSFWLMVPLEENLKLFREFALNEVGRLRGKPKVTQKT